MRKYISVLLLVLLAGNLSAQSVWTGNAAVGGSSEFPGTSEIFRAYSNSFPAGTVLQVTNPRGGASVNVKVAGRLESPGVFILIEDAAARTIGLPSDHVLPVRVTPISVSTVAEPVVIEMSDEELTDDSDYNPATDLEEDSEAIVLAPQPETEPEIIPSPSPTPAAPESETIITYDLTLSEEDTDPDSAPDTEDLTSAEDGLSGSQIYFLLPSDLRPPESVPESLTESVPDPVLSMENAVVFPVEDMKKVSPGDTGRYIQIGAYRNRAVMENTVRNMRQGAPGYPVSYAEAPGSNGTLYKLLIGPLKPAEVGVVLQAARSTAFPDAFRYAP